MVRVQPPTTCLSVDKRRPTLRIRRAGGGKWYFRIKGGNGEIVAQGQGYSTHASAKRGVRRVVRIVLAFKDY